MALVRLQLVPHEKLHSELRPTLPVRRSRTVIDKAMPLDAAPCRDSSRVQDRSILCLRPLKAFRVVTQLQVGSDSAREGNSSVAGCTPLTTSDLHQTCQGLPELRLLELRKAPTIRKAPPIFLVSFDSFSGKSHNFSRFSS